jgi:hypothetical protein
MDTILSRNDAVENGERDRLGRSHRRPADGMECEEFEPTGGLLCARSGRRDADQCARDARDPQNGLRRSG